MKQLIFLLIFTLTIISCSEDDDAQEVITNQRTFTLNCDRELGLLAIRINDSESLTIIQHTFSDVSQISVPVENECEEIMVFVQDQGFYEYEYKVINQDGTLQLEGIGQGFNSNTVVIDLSQ